MAKKAAKKKTETKNLLAVKPPEPRHLAVIRSVDQVLDANRHPTVGKFPELERRTRERLGMEFAAQEKLSDDIIRIVEKRTQILAAARETAADDLMDTFDQLCNQGLLTKPDEA